MTELSKKIEDYHLNNETAESKHEERKITLGQYLASKREERKLSLTALSQKTKINIGILKSIEADESAQYPNPIYLKGFIRSIAKELKADPQMALSLLNELLGIKNSADHQADLLSTTEFDAETLPSSWGATFINSLKDIKPRTLKILMIFLVSLGIGIYLVNIFEETGEILTQNPASPLEPPAVIENSVAPPVEAPPVTTQEVTPSTPEKPNETPSKKIILGKNYDFFPIAKALYELDPNASEINDTDLLPENIKNALISSTNNLFIHANKGDSWIIYKSDENPIKSFTLKQGRFVLIRGKNIRIFIANTDSITAFLDNKLMKINTSNGVKSIVIPQKNEMNYKTPLFVRDINNVYHTSEDYLNQLER